MGCRIKEKRREREYCLIFAFHTIRCIKTGEKLAEEVTGYHDKYPVPAEIPFHVLQNEIGAG